MIMERGNYGQSSPIAQIKFLRGAEVVLTVDDPWLRDCTKHFFSAAYLHSCAALQHAVNARESSPGRKENYTVKEGATYSRTPARTLYIHLECFINAVGPIELVAYEDEIERRYLKGVKILDRWNGESEPREVLICESRYSRHEHTDHGRKVIALGEELAQVKSFPVMTVRETEKLYKDRARLATIFAAAAKE